MCILVDLILLFMKVLSLAGCKLLYPDGEEVDLSVLAGDTAFVGEETISDDRTPGPLYTFSAEGINRIDLGMEWHYSMHRRVSK